MVRRHLGPTVRPLTRIRRIAPGDHRLRRRRQDHSPLRGTIPTTTITVAMAAILAMEAFLAMVAIPAILAIRTIPSIVPRPAAREITSYLDPMAYHPHPFRASSRVALCSPRASSRAGTTPTLCHSTTCSRWPGPRILNNNVKDRWKITE